MKVYIIGVKVWINNQFHIEQIILFTRGSSNT